MRISCINYNLTGNPMDVIASVTANGVVIFEMDSSGKLIMSMIVKICLTWNPLICSIK